MMEAKGGEGNTDRSTAKDSNQTEILFFIKGVGTCATKCKPLIN